MDIKMGAMSWSNCFGKLQLSPMEKPDEWGGPDKKLKQTYFVGVSHSVFFRFVKAPKPKSATHCNGLQPHASSRASSEAG